MNSHKAGRPTEAEKLLLLERRQKVKEMWVRGIPQWQIGRDLGVDQSQVSRDLKHIRAAIAASIADDEGKGRILAEVAKLDAVEIAAWAAWERSSRDAETRQAKTVTTPDGTRTEASKREEGQCGDPRFLTEIRACVRQRCELLGLIVVKNEHVYPHGIPVSVEEASEGKQRVEALRRELLGAVGHATNGTAPGNSHASGPPG